MIRSHLTIPQYLRSDLAAGLLGVQDSIWTPAALGSALVFEALAENATLSGSNITSLANPRGTAGAMTPASGSTYCTLDSSVLQGGKSAIRTSSTASDMRVLTGGPTGSGAFSIYALTQILAQNSGSQNDSNFFTLGNPGNDATHAPYGLGCTVVSNGAWLRAGGFQNTTLVGNTGRPLMAFNANLRLLELVSTGSLVTVSADGGKLASLATAVALDNSGRLGFSGPYPIASYGPPDSRTYGLWVFNRALTATERAQLLAYAARFFTYTPARFVDVIGDSRTQGHIAAANTTSYLEQMVSQYAGLGTPEVVYGKNDGITSETTAQIRARAEAAGFFDYFAPATFRRQRMIIRGLTNDPGAGLTPAQSYANLAAISALAQSYGIKTVISTEHCTTTSNGTDRTNVATFNALVLANSGGADAVADIRSVIPNYATTNPTTTELPDGVHQSNAILAAEATIYRSVVDSLA